MSVDTVLDRSGNVRDITEVEKPVIDPILPPELVLSPEGLYRLKSTIEIHSPYLLVPDAFDLNLMGHMYSGLVDKIKDKLPDEKILKTSLLSSSSNAWFASVYAPEAITPESKDLEALISKLADLNMSIDVLLAIKILHPELPQEFFDRRIFDSDIKNAINYYKNLIPDIDNPSSKSNILTYLAKIRLVSPNRVSINMVPEDILEETIGACEFSIKESMSGEINERTDFWKSFFGYYFKFAPSLAVLRAKTIEFTPDRNIVLNKSILQNTAKTEVPEIERFDA